MKVSGYLLVAAAAGLLTLAACQDKSRKPAGPGTAQGEVLPGSVSDAMLPLDTLRSQPPLAPISEESGAALKRKPASSGPAQPSEAASQPPPDAPSVEKSASTPAPVTE